MKPTCGAKTRKGKPCQRKLLLRGGKCPNHGGMSTGPKTPEGRQKARKAINDYWAKPEHREAAAARIRARLADPEWVAADRARREDAARRRTAAKYFAELAVESRRLRRP